MDLIIFNSKVLSSIGLRNKYYIMSDQKPIYQARYHNGLSGS